MSHLEPDHPDQSAPMMRSEERYYDADTIDGMRRKWHEQFVQPRFVDLFRRTPTYWEKDDHDHRYNDNDNTGNRPPSSELGIRSRYLFKRQRTRADDKIIHA